MLLSWRRDIDEEPIPELVDTETAMHTIFAAAHRNRRKPRYLVPLASAAAVLVIMFTGVGLAARDAQPGDTLWGLTQVLYADHARSVLAADTVRTELSHASAALHEGHYSAARTALDQAQQALPSVDNEDGQADLQAQQQNLLNQLALSSGRRWPAGHRAVLARQLDQRLGVAHHDALRSGVDNDHHPADHAPVDAVLNIRRAHHDPDLVEPVAAVGHGVRPGRSGPAGTGTGDAGSNAPDGGSSPDSPS